MSQNKYYVYTDSSRSNSSLKTGIAFVVLDYKYNLLFEVGKQILEKSNNRGELRAVIEAVKFCRQEILKIEKLVVHSDSQYVVKTLTGKWKARKNLDLINQYQQLTEDLKFKVSLVWVPREHKYIRKADQIANYFRLKTP